MAKVYSGIKGIEPPNYSDYRGNWDGFAKAEQAYIERVKEYARQNGKGPLRGEEVRFPHADGYACYVVLEGSKLIHLPVGDAWHAPIAGYITAKGIKEEVERGKRLAALFS